MAKQKRTPKEPDEFEIRKLAFSWPNLLAEASIHVVIKRGAPAHEARSLGLTALRTLIMQDSLKNPLPEAGNGIEGGGK